MKLANKYDGTNAPISSSPDGSCLFNAISLALTGAEKSSPQLRLQALLYLVRNFEQLDKMVDSPSRCSPNVMETILNCLKEGGFSSHFTIVALSNVIGRPIDVLYPSIGDLTEYSKILTKVYMPFEYLTLDPIYIMWTTLDVNPLSGQWKFNHFVPLVQRNLVETLSRCKTGIYATEAFFLSPNAVNNGAQSILKFLSPRESSLIEEIESNESPSGDSILPTNVYDQEFSPANISDSELLETNEHYDAEIAKDLLKTPPNMNQLPSKKFMSISTAYEVVCRQEVLLNQIPCGNKTDSYCLVNLNEMSQDTRGFQYYDDCGIYGTSSSNKYFFILPSMKTLKMVNGKYHSRGSKNTTKEISPQPESSRILTAYDYMTKLKFQPNFTRKIIRFESESNHNLKNVALVQYKGKFIFVYLILKGNYDMDKESGFRTKPSVLKKIKQLCVKEKTAETYIKVTNEQTLEFPRNMEQIYKVYSVYFNHTFLKARSRINGNDTEKFSMKIPDEFVKLQSMVNDPEDDYVREYSHKKGLAPTIILYKKEQIDDLEFNAKYTNDFVIGIDRTFNLGSLYVTALSYKNKRFLSSSTKDHPVKLGPVFLHKEATEEQYTYFLSSIKGKIL